VPLVIKRASKITVKPSTISRCKPWDAWWSKNILSCRCWRMKIAQGLQISIVHCCPVGVTFVIAGICRRGHPTRRREVTWTKILSELRILDHPGLVIQEKHQHFDRAERT
jgi:hypothetical protein